MRVILRLFSLALVLVFAVVATGAHVSALSAEQKRLFQGDVLFFDVNVCTNVNSTAQNNTGRATGKVYMIGDSITNGTSAQLQVALSSKGFTEVIIDGVDSRSLSEGGGPLNGIGVLQRSTDAIKDANTVIIALGTNGGINDGNIATTIATVKAAAPGAKVYWVNIGVNNDKRSSGDIDAASLNATLQNNASGQGYTVIDWASQVAAHPDYISDDGLGVHPSDAGREPFANTVAEGAVGGGSVPTDTPKPACACKVGSSTNLVGADNAEKVYNFFVGKGYTPFQAAGILGNMMVESSVEPMRLQGTAPGVETPADQVGDRVTGWGLVQWTPGSKMINPTIAAGKDPNDLGVQLEFLWEQLEGQGPIPTKQAGDLLKASTTVEEATAIFEKEYERPAALHPELRIGFARDFLTQFGSNTGGTASGGTSTCGGGGNGQVVGGFSLPVDRTFYDQHPDWFSKPHHDYAAADIPVPEGTEIYSMTAGKVIKAPAGDGCGNGVIIEAAPGLQFTYCHGSDGGAVDGAREGDTVQPGQLIMHSSWTGNVDPAGPAGTHLHLGISLNNTQYCPQTLFKSIADGSPIQDMGTLPTSGCSY